jgi:hypothetical protein
MPWFVTRSVPNDRRKKKESIPAGLVTKASPMRVRWITLLGLGLALASIEARAFAADPPSHSRSPGRARWFVNVEGEGCAAHRTLFEWEVVLACAAVSTCQVVENEREATLRATLVCERASNQPARLRTSTIDGVTLASTELDGSSIDDRLRQAAMDVARDTAPDDKLVAQTLFDLAHSDGEPVDAPILPPKKESLPRLSIGAGVTAAAAAMEEPTAGGRVVAAIRLRRESPLHLTLAGGGALGGDGEHAVRRGRAGAGIALGAPFVAKDIVGFGAEVGADISQRYPDRSKTFIADAVLHPYTQGAAYALTNIFFQVPNLTVRPYAALSLAVITSTPILGGGAELGVVVPVF